MVHANPAVLVLSFWDLERAADVYLLRTMFLLTLFSPPNGLVSTVQFNLPCCFNQYQLSLSSFEPLLFDKFINFTSLSLHFQNSWGASARILAIQFCFELKLLQYQQPISCFRLFSFFLNSAAPGKGIMAMHVSSACFSVFSHRRVHKIRAVASENVTTEVDKVKLGGSDLKVTRLGIGAWSWGDTSYWNNFEWDDRKMKAAKSAFDVSVDAGITFFDTAEVYGSRASFGAINSETLLGRFVKERKEKDPGVEIAIATKFAALPWRLGRQSVITALKDSLGRLGVSSVELYQLHWPGIWGNEGYLDGLGDAVEQGLVKAVGVSNYSERRLREAHKKLQKRGIPLASNQVNYSLIYRAPEEKGVKSTCDELGITLIAYSPIAQGALTGKYTPENPPTGPRRQIYTPEFLTRLQPVLNRIKEIGEKYSKTNTQVVLNWLIAQDNVVPIPGAKNAEQAAEFAGALGWKLNNEEVAELRSLATEIRPVTGFPVENL